MMAGTEFTSVSASLATESPAFLCNLRSRAAQVLVKAGCPIDGSEIRARDFVAFMLRNFRAVRTLAGLAPLPRPRGRLDEADQLLRTVEELNRLDETF